MKILLQSIRFILGDADERERFLLEKVSLTSPIYTPDLDPELRAYAACEGDVRLNADEKRVLAVTEPEAAQGVACTSGHSGGREGQEGEENELEHLERGV